MFWRSPYPGLRPFRSDEAHLFFGREEQTDDLLRRLKGTHFLAIVGSSGCGKSSLANAGLVAPLEAGFIGCEGSLWNCVRLHPRNLPMRRLACALVEGGVPTVPNIEPALACELMIAEFRRGPFGLLEALGALNLPREAPREETMLERELWSPGGLSQGTVKNKVAVAGDNWVGSTQQNLLILVDQFEEIFRLMQAAEVDEAAAFVALLLRTAEEAERRRLPIYIVIIIRAEFIGDCALFDGLPEALNCSQYLAPRLNRDQLRQAIVRPARVFRGDVEPDLVALLLNEIGNDQDQLPVLQHLLMRMWTWRGRSHSGAKKVLTLEDYRAVGGLQYALSRHADEAFCRRLDPPHQRIAEVMFRQISTLGEDGRAIGRPTEAGRIADLAGTTLAAVETVVNVFRDPEVSFLMPPLPEAVEAHTKLDVSHESLIRLWDHLANWTRDERWSAQNYRRLCKAANRYYKGNGELWTGEDLKSSMSWWNIQKPTDAWALQYRPLEDFRLARAFLEESQGSRRESTRRMWRIYGTTVVFLLVAVAMICYMTSGLTQS